MFFSMLFVALELLVEVLHENCESNVSTIVDSVKKGFSKRYQDSELGAL